MGLGLGYVEGSKIKQKGRGPNSISANTKQQKEKGNKKEKNSAIRRKRKLSWFLAISGLPIEIMASLQLRKLKNSSIRTF